MLAARNGTPSADGTASAAGHAPGIPGFSVLAPPVVQHGSTIRLEKAGERP